MAKLGRPKKSADVLCVCRTCNTEYTVPDWQRYGRDFCSRPCYFEWRRRFPVRNFTTPDEKTCPTCGKVFLVGGGGRPERGRIFCSRACAGTGRVRFAKPRQLKRHEATWLAGLFDGEGTIVRPRREKPRSLRISVNNTCKPLMVRLHELTGTGSLTYRPSTNPRHSDQWIWQCHADNARDLLRQMLPWLIVKREKAEEALRME